jgi:hypothetical protein
VGAAAGCLCCIVGAGAKTQFGGVEVVKWVDGLAASDGDAAESNGECRTMVLEGGKQT